MYLWAELGFVPVEESTVARNWGLPTDFESALSVAMARPASLRMSGTGRTGALSATFYRHLRDLQVVRP